MKSRETATSHLTLAPAYRTWLDHLRVLYPISGVLHIGAGTGASADLYEEWGVPNVAYIEADESRLARLTDAIKNHAGWTAHGELLSDRSCETNFYRASNLNESGMLVPEELSPLWRNLKSLKQQKLPATTIEAFLQNFAQGIAAMDFNWVHVDCLPSLALLRGAGTFLGTWDVVIARALLNEELLQARLEIGKGALDRFMAEHGYVCATYDIERHPAMAQVIYVRNWKRGLQLQIERSRSEIAQIDRERHAQASLLDTLRSKVTHLTDARNEFERQATEQKADLDRLASAHAELKQVADQRAAEIAQIDRERHAQASLLDTLRSKVTHLTDARNEFERQTMEQKADLDRLTGVHAELRQVADHQRDERRKHTEQYNIEAERLRRERDEQMRLAEERESEIKKISTELNRQKNYQALNGLDKKLEKYIDYNNGYYIEIGANDGVSQSNTYYFEKERGWAGLLVEPVLHNFLKCQMHRSNRNNFYCGACVSFNYEKSYIKLLFSNLMTISLGQKNDISDPLSHAKKGQRYLQDGDKITEIMAPARTMTSLLDEFCAPNQIDLLSLDVEGAEIDVLKGIDHSKYRMKYILVECRNIQRMKKYLKSKKYLFVEKMSHHDYLFADYAVKRHLDS